MVLILSGKRLPAEIPTALPAKTAPVFTMVPIKPRSYYTQVFAFLCNRQFLRLLW
jgi:hypothetical protein